MNALYLSVPRAAQTLGLQYDDYLAQDLYPHTLTQPFLHVALLFHLQGQKMCPVTAVGSVSVGHGTHLGPIMFACISNWLQDMCPCYSPALTSPHPPVLLSRAEHLPRHGRR